MRVQGLQNVVRNDTPIEYRRSFTATALLLAHANADPSPARIEFVIEMDPMGQRSVRVKLLDEIEYPIVPAISALKDHIQTLEQNGALP